MPSQGLLVPISMGKRIARLREEFGWTQKRLADQARISVTFLSEVENDRRMPGAEIVLRIAEALRVSVDYLLTGRLDARAPAQPLVIPSELQQAAEDQRWTVAETVDMLKANQLVIARRGRDGLPADGRLTKQDWIDMHERWFGDETRK